MPVQEKIDLGVVVQGETGQITKWVRNRSDKHIHVADMNKTCECIDVRMSRTQIAANGQVLVDFSYDGAKENDFSGSLVIEVQLSDRAGKALGTLEVSVEVVSKKAYSSL